MLENRTSVAVCLSLALALVSASAEAQDPFQPWVGRRVRVTRPTLEPRSVVGTLAESGPESLTLLRLTDKYRPVSVPRAAVTRLELSHGRKGHALVGAAVGAGVGFVAGYRDRTCISFGLPIYSDCPVSNGLFYAVLGTAPVGALVGWLIKTERWQSVPIDRIKLSIAPTRRRGVLVSTAFAF